MSTSTVTSDSPRTLDATDWERSLEKTAIPPQKISSVVRTCMSTLIQPHTQTAQRMRLSPWFGNEEVEIHGAMWAGVPFINESWREKDGSWMITCCSPSRPECGPYQYLRLSPAEKGAEAQYGMCLVRMDTFPVFAEKLLGPKQNWQIKSLVVSAGRSAPFRIDKIITSAIRLSSRKDQSAAGKEFKTLLGETSLYVFVDSLAVKCYGDISSLKNILQDTSASYKRMVHLVTLCAYPQLFSPTLEQGLSAFYSTLALNSTDGCDVPTVWPYVYTIFMPQEIFDRVSYSLEKEIPPLVPMYVTQNSWMFNGPWTDPCTGLNILESTQTHSCEEGRKILSGVLNSFNLDLPGQSSFWCPNHECPSQDWVDTFLKVADDIVGLKTEWDTTYQQDKSLFSSRKIPVLFDTVSNGTPLSRYAILQETTKNIKGEITCIDICECDSAGKPFEGKEKEETVSSSLFPDTEECSNCHDVLDPDDLVSCYRCGRTSCADCSMYCPRCEEEYCDACFELSIHDCCREES